MILLRSWGLKQLDCADNDCGQTTIDSGSKTVSASKESLAIFKPSVSFAEDGNTRAYRDWLQTKDFCDIPGKTVEFFAQCCGNFTGAGDARQQLNPAFPASDISKRSPVELCIVTNFT